MEEGQAVTKTINKILLDDNECCDRSKTVAESDGVELLKVDEKNVFLEEVAFKLDLNDRKWPDSEDLSKEPGWQRDSPCRGIKAATRCDRGQKECAVRE